LGREGIRGCNPRPHAGLDCLESRTAVTVCVESRVPTLLAEKVASRTFGEIGVMLNWVRGHRGCPTGALILSVTATLSDLLPGALGYAQP
jgi:hypothetical protein